MAAWRRKLVFLLVVYFAGFATAIYTLAPGPKKRARRSSGKDSALAALQSDEFAKSFNRGMHKCIDFSKDAACRAGKFIKHKLDESELTDG
jgi:hypothetical protein